MSLIRAQEFYEKPLILPGPHPLKKVIYKLPDKDFIMLKQNRKTRIFKQNPMKINDFIAKSCRNFVPMDDTLTPGTTVLESWNYYDGDYRYNDFQP